MYAGIDIGTSGTKVALVDAAERIAAVARRSYAVSSPCPFWSEQPADLWWDATVACFDELAQARPDLMATVRGIGLSGQMLGALLLDRADVPVRPVILWNDGRATAESEDLLAAVPDIAQIVGSRPNPGFVAPKLLWLKKHEPEALARTRRILLPKDYVRLKLTGRHATEPTDAGGTNLLDARTGQWVPDLCAAAGIDASLLPEVIGSADNAGFLLPDLARRWGMEDGAIAVAAGVGDNQANAIGVGVGRPGDAVISLGTSAVACIVDDRLRPIPEKAVLTYPHAVPGTFLSQGVVLSATNCLDWTAGLLGKTAPELAALATEAFQAGDIETAPVFLPYVNGIRTPHDMPQARGVMLGLDLKTDAAGLGWAVLEGIAFHIKEATDAQRAAGLALDHVMLVGGGARSRLWGEMIASLIDRPLDLPKSREVAASIGAARLAKVACGDGDLVDTLCRKTDPEERLLPQPELAAILFKRLALFQAAFSRLRDIL